MLVERREQVIAIWLRSTGNGRNPMFSGRRQPSCGGTSRISREAYVRFCERLGVKFPGPTRPRSRRPREIWKSTQHFPPEHQASRPGDETQRRERHCEIWKPFRPYAKGHEEDNRLEALSNAREIVNRLEALMGCCEPAPLG